MKHSPMNENDKLIRKYDVPGPRYTSYPTVPFWKEPQINEDKWLESVSSNLVFFDSRQLSVYVHLPYCESMCTFCGCHKRITKRHEVEGPYVDAVIAEWKIYREKFDVEVAELHLGGGTPTFFSPQQLKRLVKAIVGENNSGKVRDFSFEAHPNYTGESHLQTLYDLGFRRLSFGIQDYDAVVQKAINRFQAVRLVQEVHQLAKSIGYTSISHDLVYGLPKQTLAGMKKTVEITIGIRPERVSLYSYAHVPWMKGNGQRGFEESDLPDSSEKRALYELARDLFIAAGYVEVGMDHFALPEDELALAFLNKKLHRNFMGYTTRKTKLLVGLGASAISDSWFAFAQNDKTIESYIETVKNGKLAVQKGHFLSSEDLVLRLNILELMCSFSTELPEDEMLRAKILGKLESLEKDGLVELKRNKISLTSRGMPFIRNVCMAFDNYLDGGITDRLFSKTI
ncbi:MAG: oxygen-independent coproporphyrinogen III oxidase [Bacteroidota bacterium]